MRLGLVLLVCGACAGRAASGAPATLPTSPQAGDPAPEPREVAATPPAKPDPAPTAPAEPVELDDDHLIAGVRRAVAERVAPEALDAMVGRKPLVSTRNGVSLAVLRRVKLVPDEAHTDEPPDLASADAVMYWRRPLEGEDPHFVGIQIRKDGTATVFFAILLPP